MPESRPANNASAWSERAGELTSWAWARLVNRTDVWGGYWVGQDDTGAPSVNRMTRPAKKHRGQMVLTQGILRRHFAARGTRDVIGTHTTSTENTSLWGGLDLDRHGETPPAEVTERAALGWYVRLTADWGFRTLLTDSDGQGGYHLRVLLRIATPTARVWTFLRWLTRDHAEPRPPHTTRDVSQAKGRDFKEPLR